MAGLRDDGTQWGVVTRVLHWTIASLVLFQLGLGVWMTRRDDLLERFTWTQVHKSWGTVVFVLVLVRILWRLASRGRPASRPAPPTPPCVPSATRPARPAAAS